MQGCTLNSYQIDIIQLLKNKTFKKVQEAYEFVCAGQFGEISATFDKKTGKTYLKSDYLDMELEDVLDVKDYDPKIHINIPHKNELNLGRHLVHDFTQDFMSEDDVDNVYQIFKKKGAYSRFKNFLENKNMLQEWYEFENLKTIEALLDWCEDNEINIKLSE